MKTLPSIDEPITWYFAGHQATPCMQDSETITLYIPALGEAFKFKNDNPQIQWRDPRNAWMWNGR